MEVKDLKDLVNRMYKAKADADEAKKVHSEKSAYCEGLKTEIMRVMDAEELDRFEADDCKISRVTKSSARLPKDTFQKNRLFMWIHDNHGAEFLTNLQSINSASFNKFYNECEAEATERGELDFTMDGVEEPSTFSRLMIRKK